VQATALGGSIDGMLAEYVVLEEDGVMKIPPHLSVEESATLPCAGVTAWHALVEHGKLIAGQTVRRAAEAAEVARRTAGTKPVVDAPHVAKSKAAEAKAAKDAHRIVEAKAAEQARRAAEAKAAEVAGGGAKSKAAEMARNAAATRPGKRPEEMAAPPADQRIVAKPRTRAAPQKRTPPRIRAR
jgi:D-arabinose 1-dehydrogenase-like Zn-dependent alcohol dehydrogenase